MKTLRNLILLLLSVTLTFTACENDVKTDSLNLDIPITNQELEELDCYTDIHLHLDGSMTVAMIKELAEIQNMELSYTDEALRDSLQVSDNCSDLTEYLKKFPFPLRFMQTKEGLKRSVEMLCNELYQSGFIYAEIRYAPQLHCDLGMTQEEAIQAAVEGVKNSPIPVGLILCCMRDKDNEEQNMETVQLAQKYLGKEVVAIDIAGAEAMYPTEDFEDVFSMASQKNIPFTIHAGEAAGPQSVYKALEYGAKRIGHGVRSTEDEALMKKLQAERIILECCPTSNVNTAIYTNISGFPFRTLMDNGIKFTVNSDNMSVSNTSTRKEFILLNNAFKMTRGEVMQLLNNSVDAAFTTKETKEKLYEKILTSFKSL